MCMIFGAMGASTGAATGAPKVVVSGMVAGTPGQGGAAWAVLQYLLGLRRLGWDPYLIEPVEGDIVAKRSATHCARVMKSLGFEGRWALVPRGRGEPAGLNRAQIRELGTQSDLLLNISGMLEDEDVLASVTTRVFLDLDPAFTQLWHSAEGVDMGLDAHTHLVTIADSIGSPGSPIPDCGRRWVPTLPPVVLDAWPVAGSLDRRALTTVGHWRSYGSIDHRGVHYGQRAHSLRSLFEVPDRIQVPVEVALGIHPDESEDLVALRANGWRLLDPYEVAATPAQYRRFVAGSWAELGVAKSGYAVSDSGWFSDRSACYLASGRPVIAQDTGFGRRLPAGAGLLAFGSVDEVVTAVDELIGDYEHHRRAARTLAEDLLDSDVVLRRLLERL